MEKMITGKIFFKGTSTKIKSLRKVVKPLKIGYISHYKSAFLNQRVYFTHDDFSNGFWWTVTLWWNSNVLTGCEKINLS